MEEGCEHAWGWWWSGAGLVGGFAGSDAWARQGGGGGGG